MAGAKWAAFFMIVSWLAMLFSTIGLAASDFFCANLSSIATMAGMSENFAGVTLLALGNGSPDVFSTFAAMYNNSGSLAIGELVGAAGFITAVVAGLMAFIRPFKVPRKTFLRDVIFFIVAAAFTLVFLADGKLYLWECIAMVVLYIVYVCVVVWWHWHFGKVSRRKRTEAAARSHYNFPGTGAAELGDQYRDEEEDRDPRDMAGVREDFAALERAGRGEEDSEQEEELERMKGQLTSQMRLRRPTQRNRRSTHLDKPIRPSLLGALEFQSVLTGLQRAGNLQSYPLHNNTRRFSDVPSQARSSTWVPNFSDPNLLMQDEQSETGRPIPHRTASGNRLRAASAVEGTPRGFAPSGVPRIDLLGPVDDASPSHVDFSIDTHNSDLMPHPSPSISISPPASEHHSDEGTNQGYRDESLNSLAIPTGDSLSLPSPQQTRGSRHSRHSNQPKLSTVTSNEVGEQEGTEFPLYSDDAFSASPINTTTHSPFMLPPPAETGDSSLDVTEDQQKKPISWWPYRFLPSPEVLASTLFPTLCSWKEKSWIGRILAVLSTPSVFLLTITLPVVEIEKDDDDNFDTATIRDPSLPHTGSSSPILNRSYIGNGDFNGSQSTDGPQIVSHAMHGAHPTSAVIHTHRSHTSVSTESGALVSSPTILAGDQQNEPDSWNRWLVLLQMFTAPFFCVVIVWANVDYGNGKLLLDASLGSLVVSVVLATLIHFTTEADRPPKWQGVLCVLGFCVSIAWISTIAGEVVGVLKAIGVIFNISDAVLGLTVFAVGNSLGDLVADVTIARLGYSVMALSACFGGPMLNILLGIGLSGAYMTVHGAQEKQHKHPGKKFKVMPYIIEVDRTLMISGIALLVTLVGLLIAVPLRGWKMDRVIGWGLIGCWILSTAGNLVTELILGPNKWTKHL
jgi:sodium/potassium/calcium exchanger 6